MDCRAWACNDVMKPLRPCADNLEGIIAMPNRFLEVTMLALLLVMTIAATFQILNYQMLRELQDDVREVEGRVRYLGHAQALPAPQPGPAMGAAATPAPVAPKAQGPVNLSRTLAELNRGTEPTPTPTLAAAPEPSSTPEPPVAVAPEPRVAPPVAPPVIAPREAEPEPTPPRFVTVDPSPSPEPDGPHDAPVAPSPEPDASDGASPPSSAATAAWEKHKPLLTAVVRDLFDRKYEAVVRRFSDDYAQVLTREVLEVEMDYVREQSGGLARIVEGRAVSTFRPDLGQPYKVWIETTQGKRHVFTITVNPNEKIIGLQQSKSDGPDR